MRRRRRDAVEPSRLHWADTVAEAAATIADRPVRALLTALGTILGVATLVTTTGLAQTARTQVSARFDALRATEVRITDARPDGTDPFPADTDARLARLAGVRHAGVVVPLGDPAALDPRSTATPTTGAAAPIPVLAATPGAVAASLPTLATGRVYDAFHEQRAERVAVVGRVAAERLGITRVDHRPVVFLGDVAVTVVGIVDDARRTPDLLLAITIPLSTAAGLVDLAGAERQVLIDTAPGAAQLIGRQAPLALRPQDAERLQAIVPPDPRTLREQIETDVQTLFYALAALALAVGTIAITNATLLATIERRPEIGLRRALGATRGHVVRHVTLDAAVLGALAGVVGTVLGIGAVAAAAIARGWTPTVQPAVVLAAPAIGLVTGTLAGVVPAIRAASTPPATTLRT